jgi:hypothetical protein
MAWAKQCLTPAPIPKKEGKENQRTSSLQSPADSSYTACKYYYELDDDDDD